MATVTKSDSQAKVNADKEKVPDASEAAKAREATKGDVDVVKQQEQHADDQRSDVSDEDRVDDALKARDEHNEEERKIAEERDEDQADSLKTAAEAKAQPAPDELRTLAETRSASDLVNRSWTVQSDVPFYEGGQEVGQAFVKAQLPNRAVQKEAGINPDQQTAGLVVLDDDGATKDVASGPEPWESRDLGLLKN